MENLVKTIMKIRSDEEAGLFLRSILSHKEIETLNQRIEIALLIMKGRNYKEIERATGASSATIAKINNQIKYGNGLLSKVLSRLDKSK